MKERAKRLAQTLLKGSLLGSAAFNAGLAAVAADKNKPLGVVSFMYISFLLFGIWEESNEKDTDTVTDTDTGL